MGEKKLTNTYNMSGSDKCYEEKEPKGIESKGGVDKFVIQGCQGRPFWWGNI